MEQGTWDPTDYGAKDTSVPGVSTWVTKQDGTGAGLYRMAECVRTTVTVSAIWTDPASDAPGSTTMISQPFSKLVVRKATKFADLSMYRNVKPSQAFNSDQQMLLPYVKSADMKSSQYGSASKGATITMKYAFRNLNSTSSRSYLNHFSLDTPPSEKDFLHVMILPTANSYGLEDRCGRFRVTMKVVCDVNLSEPNTAAIGGEGKGLDYSDSKASMSTPMTDDQGAAA